MRRKRDPTWSEQYLLRHSGIGGSLQQPMATAARHLRYTVSTTEYDHIRSRYVQSLCSQSTCGSGNTTTSRRSAAAFFSYRTGTWNTASRVPCRRRTHVCPYLSTNRSPPGRPGCRCLRTCATSRIRFLLYIYLTSRSCASAFFLFPDSGCRPVDEEELRRGYDRKQIGVSGEEGHE